MNIDPAVPSKIQARADLRARRRHRTPEAREALSRRLAEAVLEELPRLTGRNRAEKPPVIAAYLGVPPEPATEELLHTLTDLGSTVIVPICEPDYRLSWCPWWPGVPLVKSPRAPVMEPEGTRTPLGRLAALDLVLVPGLAVDASGYRLGQGGGYYDRFLAELSIERPTVPTAGMVYPDEFVAAGSFPVELHDVPLHGVFTPGAYHGFGAAPASV
ncbi:5-formyltetrahydrofolate cyclo-ligase [Arthrobacter sp. MSA 4-2]|uniref:5-formyltetrahydrofolate cyclo-ligase n=1 Tax=Arthrobacter sp. MSA 4-2 TaxID=2794349 RepID=UPI0018E7A214|nr:5-formyltetrahydrofolate cyclo-ligase [Arthrobacter sp. MSA 4-2]MBJ2120611.1 5-formyltetrahydrofolate cyclo-ligase [Arthrobacter sp. MSA 4-2]